MSGGRRSLKLRNIIHFANSEALEATAEWRFSVTGCLIQLLQIGVLKPVKRFFTEVTVNAVEQQEI